MKLQTLTLTGRALNYAVALAEKIPFTVVSGCLHDKNGSVIDYLSPDKAYPIIKRECIAIDYSPVIAGESGPYWCASGYYGTNPNAAAATDPIVAALRIFAMEKLGDEVDIPTEMVDTDLNKQKIANAFASVREHYPLVVQVFFGADGRWLYMDDDMEAPAFNDKIDVGILEDAADAAVELKGLPCAFSVFELNEGEPT